MKCAQAKSLMSPYLDSRLTGRQMISLREHLGACRNCEQLSRQTEQAQRAVAALGSKKAPPDLELKLRLAISREVARSNNLWLHGIRIRMEHALNAFMVPATAGLAATVIIFGVLMTFLTPPLQANNSDVPLAIQTDPQFQQSAFGSAIGSIKEDSLVIEAYVDSKGRVEDYRILSSPGSGPAQGQDLPAQVKNMLIFTTFRPATLMGKPTSGRAVMSFSKISVRG